MTVLDASAILAFLNDEPGADEVETAMVQGAVVGAANWSEVAQKVGGRGGVWNEVRALILNYEIAVEPVTRVDAELAAELWKPGKGLSLADRLCIALGHRLNARVLTADRQWGTTKHIRQIR